MLCDVARNVASASVGGFSRRYRSSLSRRGMAVSWGFCRAPRPNAVTSAAAVRHRMDVVSGYCNCVGAAGPRPKIADIDPGYMSSKFESLERINSIRETNGSFDACISCKRLGTSRLHEIHVPKLPFVSRIEFVRFKLSIFLFMYPGSQNSARRRIQERALYGESVVLSEFYHSGETSVYCREWR